MARKFLNGIDLANVGKVSNALDPSSAQDLVTLNYLQAFIRGLTNKQAVRAASTANVSLSTPGATLDGVTLNNGDRILLKNQSTASQNAIYVWSGASTTLVVAADSTSGNLAEGDTTLAAEGTVNAATSWTLQVSLTSWVQTGGTSVSYTAATSGGLSLASSAFSVKLPTSSGLIADSTGLYVDQSIVTRKYASNVGDGTSTTITITHNLGTRDITWRMYDTSAYAEVEADVVHATINTVTITFASAPAAAAYRIAIFA